MDTKDKSILLALARDSIEAGFKHQEPNINDSIHLNEDRGVFVTLHKKGVLRGCIGYPEPVMPLYKAVVNAAKGAAFGDPRFPIVSKDEMRDIKIEISVLSVPKIIVVSDSDEYPKNIVLGTDGLIIRSDRGFGLLLPQVATENNMSEVQFLNALCQKAGLSFNVWKDEDVEILKFQAEIFSE